MKRLRACRLWIAFLLVSTACFTSGCLVVRSKHLSRPVGPPKSVRLSPTTDEWHYWFYHRLFRSNDFNLDVSVHNTADRHQLFFWFYVLPLPDLWYDGDVVSGNLSVQIQIEPKKGSVHFDPSRTFYSTTNRVLFDPRNPLYWTTNVVRATPVSISEGFSPPQSEVYRLVSEDKIMAVDVSVSSNTWFRLDFDVYGTPERCFELSIEGLSVDGQSISLPPIKYEPATIFRPEMVLPY